MSLVVGWLRIMGLVIEWIVWVVWCWWCRIIVWLVFRRFIRRVILWITLLGALLGVGGYSYLCLYIIVIGYYFVMMAQTCHITNDTCSTQITISSSNRYNPKWTAQS